MSTPSTPAPSPNRLGIALLIAAVVCLIGFHLSPIPGDRQGWYLWIRIWKVMTSGDLPRGADMIAVSAFLTVAVLVTASPFVAPLLRTSKPFRWLAITVSGAALLGLGSLIVNGSPKGPAVPLLLSAMALNFIGLICLRGPRPGMATDPS